MISKQQYEAQLRQIFKLLLENKTQDEIARELNIGVRTVSRYTQRIEKRYGEMQRLKTDNTIFLESQLFKNRLLQLYNILEKKAQDPKVNGNECAKCCEVASNIALDVLKMESEGIKAVKQGRGMMAEAAAAAAKTARTLSTVTDSDMMEELENSC
jgi:DNA-binding transcriptional regulator LsrR (DeoR family)